MTTSLTFLEQTIKPFPILATPTPTPRKKESVLEKKYEFSEIGRGINFTLVERKIPLVPKKSLVILLLWWRFAPRGGVKTKGRKKGGGGRGKKRKKKTAVACLECGGESFKTGKEGGGQETRSLLSVSLVFRPSCWHASAQFRLTTKKEKKDRTERTISVG